jgi:hypothetical protein
MSSPESDYGGWDGGVKEQWERGEGGGEESLFVAE